MAAYAVVCTTETDTSWFCRFFLCLPSYPGHGMSWHIASCVVLGCPPPVPPPRFPLRCIDRLPCCLESVFFALRQGTILLAVNPLKAVPEPPLEDFMDRTLDPERPHPYAIAEVCFL